MATLNQKDKKRGDFYWYHGKPYVSVTQVLKVIDKPALRFWFGREVYRFFAKNPNAGEQEALNAPWSVSGVARNRGTTVHSIVESWETTGKVITNTPPQFQGYARAFESWVNEYQAQLLEHERTIINTEHKYAGTLDLMVNINHQPAIIDVKTGKDIYAEAGLQLSAYKHGDEVKADKVGVVLLQEDGNYKFQWLPDDFDTFLHVKAVWEWLNREMLEGYGY
jgi:hypothetical protein